MTVVTIVKENFNFHYKGECQHYEDIKEIKETDHNAIKLVKSENWYISVNLDHYRIEVI